MAAPRRERTITVSGLNGYFQLLPEEQKAFRCEIFFSGTNVGRTNYYSFEWYKERTLYGRFKIARGEYTTREKLLQYQNELIYSEEATLFEVIKRLQCQRQQQYEVNKYVVQQLADIASRGGSPLPWSSGSTAFDQIPPQPIFIPGLQIDGVYFNMFPGCAGKITIQTWYDDDLCKDVNGNPLTQDNRGKPPDPASTGRPPTDAPIPPPTFPADQTYKDPDPNSDVPTDKIKNPGEPEGFAGTLYNVTVRWDRSVNGNLPSTPYEFTVIGQYGPLIDRNPSEASVDYGFYQGIGAGGFPAEGSWMQVLSGGGPSVSEGVDIKKYIQSISFAQQ